MLDPAVGVVLHARAVCECGTVCFPSMLVEVGPDGRIYCASCSHRRGRRAVTAAAYRELAQSG